jgi:hypothetical protein
LLQKIQKHFAAENTKTFCSRKIQKCFVAGKYKNILKHIAHTKIHNVFLKKNTKTYCCRKIQKYFAHRKIQKCFAAEKYKNVL